jgi:hypothetical protein
MLSALFMESPLQRMLLLLAAYAATLLLLVAALRAALLRRKPWPRAPGRPLRTMVVLGSGWLHCMLCAMSAGRVPQR